MIARKSKQIHLFTDCTDCRSMKNYTTLSNLTFNLRITLLSKKNLNRMLIKDEFSLSFFPSQFNVSGK